MYKNTVINLLGVKYSIKFMDTVFDKDRDGTEVSVWGLCDHDKRSIYIATKNSEMKPRSRDEVRITLIHEILHAICTSYQYFETSSDEPFVEIMARSINSMINSGLLKRCNIEK